MSRRYSYNSDAGERAPLDHSPYALADTRADGTLYSPQRHPASGPPMYDVDASQPQYEDESLPYRDYPSSPPPPPAHSARSGAHPGTHPDSSFARLHQGRAQGGATQGELLLQQPSLYHPLITNLYSALGGTNHSQTVSPPAPITSARLPPVASLASP
ncbi:hypothetical protein RRF57_002423 [Xylaria bambusicola]|uniref:Uncharacterized protein n=1 Tax=Xylaria bambusicola TaxID=326684 RepID=A0AAN7Z4G5_9PEZI